MLDIKVGGNTLSKLSFFHLLLIGTLRASITLLWTMKNGYKRASINNQHIKMLLVGEDKFWTTSWVMTTYWFFMKTVKTLTDIFLVHQYVYKLVYHMWLYGSPTFVTTVLVGALMSERTFWTTKQLATEFHVSLHIFVDAFQLLL